MSGPRSRHLLAALALGVLAASFGLVADVVGNQLSQPYDLGYESPSLATIRLLRDGRNPYDADVYADVPFTFTMYTPLYHHVVAALPAADDNAFLTGRVVSLACLLLASASLFAVRGRRGGLAVPALALGVFFLQWPILGFAAYLKSDSMALLCSAAAVVVVARGARGRGALAAAALLCTLAVAAKQSYVAAGGAILVHLLAGDRRRAATFAVLLAGSAGAAAALATALWGAGFWFSVVLAPANPMSLSGAAGIVRDLLGQPVFVLLLVLTAWTAWAASRAAGGPLALAARSPLLPWVALSGLLAALTAGKLGATHLYFLEFTLAQLAWQVHALGDPATVRLPRGLATAACILLVACLGWEVHARRAFLASHDGAPEDTSAARERYYQGVRAALTARGLERPSVLNLGPPGHGYAFADDVSVNDYTLYAILWSSGKLDLQVLLDRIAERRFDLVLVSLEPVPLPADDPSGRIEAAVAEHYRRRGQDAVYAYWVRP